MADKGLAIGIPQLDAVLAPAPRGASVLVLNDPGLEAEPFLYQSAAHHLKEGRDVVYAVTNRGPASVLNGMRAYGFDAASYAGTLRFLDAFSPLMGASEGAEFSVADPTRVDSFADTVARAADTHPGAVLLVDSLSTLADNATPEAFTSAFASLRAAMARFDLSASLFTRWPYSEEMGRALASFDALVSLRGVEDRVLYSQYFSVERAAWQPDDLDVRPRLYKVMKPGGVFVYIPKIIITGPYNAGKSTFVHAVSDSAVSVDRLGTTVALDHGRFTMDGLTADVFGTPGQSRFDPILRTVAGQALGVIVVVDSTKPDTFERAREMMRITWRQGIPGIIAANKQDLPGALPPEEVERLIEPPPTVRTIGCAGQDRASSRVVLRTLVDQILTGGMQR